MDDETLVRYLVGTTTDEETESLDELSIADEAFALRLRAVEHDLVDAYANGELSGSVLEHFMANYLSSPAGRAKVEIAKTLRAYGATRAAASDGAARPGTRWHSRTWLVAAAAVLLAIAATLAFDDLRLRRSAADARQQPLALEQRERERQEAVGRQQPETAGAAQAQERENVVDRKTQPAARTYTLAILLFPATRDAQRLPIVALSKSVEAVTLMLDVGPDDSADYRAAIEDAASDRVVWRSGALRAAVSPDGRKQLAITVPANQLQVAEYALKLTGVSAKDNVKALDNYPFRVVLQ